MLQNKDIETLRMLFSSHNYVMTTAELTASKLYYADIKQLLDEGLIERVRRGYYHWTQDYGESEVVIIHRLFPDAVLCMETALFYYRYSDRNPAEWNFAIDKNVSKRRTKIDYPFIKAYRVVSELVTLGETEGEIDFHKVRIYDRDRTICDELRNMNKMDKEYEHDNIRYDSRSMQNMNISIAELARRINQSPQNINKKLKRGTVSSKEMIAIAKVLDITYEQRFILNDGTIIRYGN